MSRQNGAGAYVPAPFFMARPRRLRLAPRLRPCAASAPAPPPPRAAAAEKREPPRMGRLPPCAGARFGASAQSSYSRLWPRISPVEALIS